MEALSKWLGENEIKRPTPPRNPKFALVNEATGQITAYLGGDEVHFVSDAFKLALDMNPRWREERLKLWVLVAGQD